MLTIVGRIAYLSVSIHATIEAGAFRRVATLPDGIRPQVGTYACMANFPGALVRAFVSAETGDISFYVVQTQDGVSGSMCFPLA